MADARKFEIQISSSFSPDGTRKASEGLKEVGQTGKKSAESLFESHREVHKLLHAIGNEAIPGMGQAFGALAHGPLGAIVAISLAVEFLKKNIEETNKQLDEMSATASKAFGGGDSLTDYIKAVGEAASQTEALAAALKKASESGSEVTNRYASEAKAIHEVVEALKAKLKAEGKSVPGDALDSAEAQAMQQARSRELAERQGNQDTLNNAATATLTPANVIDTRNERASELAAQEAALAKATSDMNTEENDKLKEKLEKAKAHFEFNASLPERDPEAMKQLQNEVDQLESRTAEGRAAAAKEKIKQLSGQIAKDTENAAKEKTAREEATNAATENAKRVVALQKEIAEASNAAAIKSKSAPKLISSLLPYVDTQTFESAAGLNSESGAAGFVQQFLAAQSRLSQHRGTAQDSDTIRLMNNLLQASGQSDQGMLQILQALINSHGQTNGRIDALWKQLNTTNSRIPRGSTTNQ